MDSTGTEVKKEIFTGALVSFLIKGIGLLIAYLFAFSVARLLGADAWGEFSLSLSLITFGSIISAAGFETLLLKESSSKDKKYSLLHLYRRSSLLSLILSALIASVLFINAPIVASVFFSNPELTHSFKISSFAIPAFAFMNINAGILQGFKKLKKYVFIRFVSHHAGGLLLFLLILYFQRESHVVVLAYTISLYLIALLSFVWINNERHRMSQHISTSKSGHTLTPSQLLLKASPFMLAALLFFMKGWLDTVLIGVFLDEKSVGIYNIALKLTALIIITLSAVSAVSTPLYSEAYSAGDKINLQRHVHHSTAIVFYTSLPIFLILVLFPEQILLLFGEEFRDGKIVLIILAAGGLINAYFGASGYFMKMTGSEVMLQKITLVTVIIALILNLTLIPAYGIEGAAVATALSILIWNISCTLYIKKMYEVRVYYIPKVIQKRLNE